MDRSGHNTSARGGVVCSQLCRVATGDIRTSRQEQAAHKQSLIVGANSYEDLCDRIGQKTIVPPVGYLFAGANGKLLFKDNNGKETPSTLDQALDSHVIDDVVMVDSSAGLDPDDILYSSSIRGKTFRTLIRTPLASAGRYRTQDLGAGEYLLSHETVPVREIPLAIKRLMEHCRFSGWTRLLRSRLPNFCAPNQAGDTGLGNLSTDSRRPQRPSLHALQVPHDESYGRGRARRITRAE